jgi:glycosyltransferase involved in cell wall biosynthesis
MSGRPRLRIGIEAHVIGRRQTGNERVMANLVRALRKECDHELVLYFTDPAAATEWRSHQYPRTTVQCLRFDHPLLRLTLGLPRAAARDRLDVFLAHAHRPLIRRCPVVCIIHDMVSIRLPHDLSLVERAYMPFTIRASIRTADAVVVVSEFTRREVLALCGGVDPKKIVAVPNAADPIFVNAMPGLSPVDPPFFLAIGNLQPRKNLLTLVRAFKQLVEQHPAVEERLVLVGQDRGIASAIESESVDLRATGRLITTGYVDDQILVDALGAATAFVFPSLYEGFGLPPLEAMTMGIPVAVADIPAMREVVADAGLLVPATDVDAWCNTLRRLATEQTLRRELSERGLARSRKFSWQDSARKVLSVLEAASSRKS